MKRTVLIALKIAWVIACVVVLVVTLAKFDGKPTSDIGDFEAWTMLVLSFPAEWLVVALFVGVAAVAEHSFRTVIPTSYGYLSILWLLWFIVGYLQWLVSLSWVIRWVKQRRSSNVPKTSSRPV